MVLKAQCLIEVMQNRGFKEKIWKPGGGFAQRAQNLFKPSLLHKTPWLQALNLMFHFWSMAMQTLRVYKVKPDLCSRRQSKSVPMKNA